MRINLIRAKNADLVAFVRAGNNILNHAPGCEVLDLVNAVSRELRRRGRDPKTGKRLTARPR